MGGPGENAVLELLAELRGINAPPAFPGGDPVRLPLGRLDNVLLRAHSGVPFAPLRLVLELLRGPT
eukprot:3368043-Lingulodinium_polyedra.AAC.1